MNRKQRRALGVKGGERSLLGAQARSRTALVAAIREWTALLGATFVEPNTRSTLLRQRDGKAVVVSMTIGVHPATEDELRAHQVGESWETPTHFTGGDRDGG